jgi:hypothetical protein
MSPLLIRSLLALAVLGWMVRRGYKRRRPVWTRASWIRLIGILAGTLGLFALSMAMAIGVDNGVYEGMSPLAHRTYFVTLMALTLLAPLAFVGIIVWFANGRPDRQIGRQSSSRGA